MHPKIHYFAFVILFCFACQQPSSSKNNVEEVKQPRSSQATMLHDADSNINERGVILEVKPSRFKANDEIEVIDYLVTNHTDSTINFGSQFAIEKWDGKEWKAVPFKDNIGFIDILYAVEPGNTREYPLYFSTFIDKVDRQPGKYRLIKEVFHRGKKEEKIRLAAEFILK